MRTRTTDTEVELDPAEVGDARLLKLADWLCGGKCGHTTFSFATYNTRMLCGTAGCALGECPFIWPDAWAFDGIYVKRVNGLFTLDAAEEWFALEDGAAKALFMPGLQRSFDLPYLDGFATRHAVASNIRTFVHRRQAARMPVLRLTVDTTDANHVAALFHERHPGVERLLDAVVGDDEPRVPAGFVDNDWDGLS